MAIGTRENQLKTASARPPQKSHRDPEMFFKECPFIFVDRINQTSSPSKKCTLMWVSECGNIYFLRNMCEKKCLFKSWMLIGFHEDISRKSDDWLLKTTLKPRKCFFKECQKSFLHGAHAALKNDPLKHFREHNSPHFANKIWRGKQNQPRC